jgi:phage repressor protein C with HTH and peptisase S24 domain
MALVRPRGFLLARVSGASMVPTLRDGDVVVARRDSPVAAGDVVLARYRSMPTRMVVKRAVRVERDGWWLASDNPYAGGSSETHGVADVTARVGWVLRGGCRPTRIRRTARSS